MYLPAHFEETRPEVLHQLMHEHGLATLVTMSTQGLNANHIPLEFDPEPSPFGTLRGHVARANPLWRDLSPGAEALAIFQGPQAYISPGWYATKKDSGKVVPTYNYIVVHAYGSLRIIDDPEWLRGLVGRLTTRYESTRAEPWHVTDAPADFVDTQLRAIVGLELPITRLIGKWKASQNRPRADRDGVVAGLRERDDANAQSMADYVAKNGKP